MRKFIIVLFFITLFTPVFAQNAADLPKLYYINVPIERIYPSNEGYIIQYRNSTGSVSIIGVPNEWFSDAAGRADLVRLQPGTDWPTMSIFYSNGQFSHVRLYVHRSRAHQTWGNIPMGSDVNRFFGDRNSFNLEF